MADDHVGRMRGKFLVPIVLVPRQSLGTRGLQEVPPARGASARQSLASSAFPGRAWERGRGYLLSTLILTGSLVKITRPKPSASGLTCAGAGEIAVLKVAVSVYSPDSVQ